MALIKKLQSKEPSRVSVHKPIEATYFVADANDERVLQIDTYGSSDRKIPGKTSQSVQFDEESARELFEILRREFKF